MSDQQLLIVDDDATFARVLARALSSRGFEVITASNADEARMLTRRHQPRYCVLDLKLGDENGLRLIPELQALVPDIRVLLLTGYASIATAVEAIKRGAHDYLAKPVDADAVVRALLDGDTNVSEDDVIDAPEAPLAFIRRCLLAGRVRWTYHVTMRLQQRGLDARGAPRCNFRLGDH